MRHAKSFEERIRSLEADLEKKERVIRELDHAALERLALINRLTGTTEPQPAPDVRTSNASGESAGPGLAHFSSLHYQVHNGARLDHLQSLRLPLFDSRVLELGSGPGDHTGFYLERRCSVVSVDARQECLDVLAQRFPGVRTVRCDLNEPGPLRELGSFDIVHCYGILYHLEKPEALLEYMAEACTGFAIVETCVSVARTSTVERVNEVCADFTQALGGRACRPTRQWVFDTLGRRFPFVYHTKTQPDHPEFPTGWKNLEDGPQLVRSVFVASKRPLELPALSPVLLDAQLRLGDTTCNKGIDLVSMLGGRAPGLRILDAGALFTPDAPPAYTPLLAGKSTTVVGFEPSQAECNVLNSLFGPVHKFFPYVIGDGGKASFHRCNHAMTSSLFPPDLEVMGPFQNLPEFCEVVEISEVATVRLDDVPEARGADYIKLDVQGAGGQVLAGAQACLDSVLVVQTEVGFVQIYEGQPLFGDIDATLRAHGFMFHRLSGIEGRTLRGSGFVDRVDTRSQQLWADAVYIRPPMSWGALSSEQLLKLAVILHQLYDSADFCACLLAAYDRREGTAFAVAYTGAVRG